MEYTALGSSSLSVSRVCLGSMTWGKQNNQQDADQQIHYALAQGVNFIDTAEMYACPPSPETYGETERVIGDWLSRHQSQRKDIVIASKIAGSGLHWVRGGADITGDAVIKAVDQSLQRLQTDYIDLYQLHWPNRVSPHFGKHWPGRVSPSAVDAESHKAQMLDILQGLDACVKAGKIRYCGLSDDTPWGIQTYLELAKTHSLPRMVSIQNEFNLLHTKDWPYLIEQCVYEKMAYLPWSPLAAGMLTGKYLNNRFPEGSRWSISKKDSLFRNQPTAQKAVAEYVALAKTHNMTPAQLALAWVNQVDGVTSTIIGATSIAQLEENITAFSRTLSDDVLRDVGDVFRAYPVPF